jgi:hypothetical protein
VAGCQVVTLSDEQPLPVCDHAVSVKPRVLLDRRSVVPPTDVTHFEDAESPE